MTTPRLDLPTLLSRAIERRKPLVAAGHTNAIRFVHDTADGLAGLVVERFGPALIVQAHVGRLAVSLDGLRTAIEPHLPAFGVQAAYLKHFVRDRAAPDPNRDAEHRTAEPWIGTPTEPEFAITEHGLQLLIRPYDGFSVGLFLEHRDNRRRVFERSAGRRVLNLFAYTCGFSVAAAASGATHVASVDLSRRYLEWGKRNFAAANLPIEPHRFYASDAFEFFARAHRQHLRYDLVIVDPPTFSRQRRPARDFVLKERLDELIAGAAALLEPRGELLVAVNDRGLSPDALARAVRSAGGAEVVERPALPIDFAGDPDYAKCVWARRSV